MQHRSGQDSGIPEHQCSPVLCRLVTFVTLYDDQPLLPLFAREFGVSPAVASLPLSFSTIALALGILIAGTVSETVGRRQVITAALFLTSLLATGLLQ